MRPIGFVLSPGFQVMSFAALSVFEFANKEMGEPVYDVRVLSETGGLMRSSIGVSIATEPLDATIFDTLFFCRGTEPSTPGLIEFLRQAPERCRRVAATCTGAFILAEAGLLDGRRATTHWNRARDLQALFPKVKVEEDRIFIVDGPVWTSAGPSPDNSWSITGVPVANRSFRHCWSWSRNPTVSRAHWPMPSAISISR